MRYAKSAKAWHSLGTWPITTFPLAAASTRSPRCYAQLLQCASSVLPGGSQAYEHGVPDMQTTTDSNNPTIQGQRLLGPQAVCCLRGCPLVTCSPHERTRRRPHTNTASQQVLFTGCHHGTYVPLEVGFIIALTYGVWSSRVEYRATDSRTITTTRNPKPRHNDYDCTEYTPGSAGRIRWQLCDGTSNVASKNHSTNTHASATRRFDASL